MTLSMKKKIVDNNLYSHYSLAKIYQFELDFMHKPSDYLTNLFDSIYNKYHVSYKDIINLRISDFKKFKRIKTRIEKMDNNNLWFCTWTISDKYLKRDHKRKLKSMYSKFNYIINLDFGKKNGRKHYHGIIESINMPIAWSYGFCKFIKVDNSDSDKLSKYLNKITNHALKDTTLSDERIIYSRKKGV